MSRIACISFRDLTRLVARLVIFSCCLRGYADDIAIIIGVNRTESSEIDELSFAVADADLIEEKLKQGGFNRDGLIRISDNANDGARLPVIKNIRRELRDQLSQMQPDDRLIVFFSGHATIVNGEWYFVTQDFDKARPAETGLPFTELQQILAACPAKHRLLLLDCCRRELGKSAEPPDQAIAAATFNQFGSTALIAGCRPGQKSWESQSLGHGYFTVAIAEALSGKANQETAGKTADAWVDSDELRNYVLNRVPELASTENYSQQPVVNDFYSTASFNLTKVSVDSTSLSPTSRSSARQVPKGDEADAKTSLLNPTSAALLIISAVFFLIWLFKGLGRRPKVVRSVGRDRQAVN